MEKPRTVINYGIFKSLFRSIPYTYTGSNLLLTYGDKNYGLLTVSIYKFSVFNLSKANKQKVVINKLT